jgi:uncharacterized SAM-binding protein YcdF (DUF218 family)
MKKRNGILFAVIVLCIVQFPIFYGFWLTRIGAFLVYKTPLKPADAILVLGGGKIDRVLQGIELFKKQYGRTILFTGEEQYPLYSPPTHWALEAQKVALAHGVPKEKIIAITGSRSTYDDAVLSKKVCEQHKLRSLIVVSEPFHTRRAYYVFRKVYRKEHINVMICPTQESWYDPKHWWQSEAALLATNEEYVKILYYLLKGYI